MVRSATVFLLLLLTAPAAWAGGGPTTTLIVVNEDSPTSLYVGTWYARLRQIPTTHLCRLRDIPNRSTITVDQFRERVWMPIAAYLKKHDLEASIDCIAYSTDFPFGVKFDADFDEPRKGRVPRTASLNAMTFLARRVVEKDRNYTGDRVNKYCRTQQGSVFASHGFRSAFEWTRDKLPVYAPELDAEPLDRYWLSTLLGFSGLQGNTTDEVLAYLRTGAQADGTSPDGTVYLMSSKDVRATTRFPMFRDAIEELTQRKRKATIVQQDENGEDGKIPKSRADVLGLVAGTANFDWSRYGCTLVPGAIAEHLTSFGGRLDGSGQTKLTAFLRAGAVGSSGTVAEPLALWWKFPTPFLHAHYADGCSLAEAFYQSVSGPYQLLIVGDPLARPFATFVDVSADVSAKKPVKGTFTFTPSVPGEAYEHLEAFVDGRLVGSAKVKEAIEIDTTRLDDGYHTLRVVAVESGPIRTRSLSEALRFRVANGSRSLTLKTPRKAARLDQTIKLSGKCQGKPQTIEVLHGATPLATVTPKGSGWKATIPALRLGRGDHALVARAIYAEEPAVRSAPGTVKVASALSPSGKKPRRKPRKKNKPEPKKGRAGLHAEVTDANGKPHSLAVTWLGRQGKNQFIKQLRGKLKGKLSRIVLTGEMHTATDGVYQLAFNATGDLTVKLHGKPVFEARDMAFDKVRFAEVVLPAGWHPLVIEYSVKGTGDLSIELGGAQVTQVLNTKALRH